MNKYAQTESYTKRRKARSIIEVNSFPCHIQISLFKSQILFLLMLNLYTGFNYISLTTTCKFRYRGQSEAQNCITRTANRLF